MAASGSCEDHGSTEICRKCMFRDFISQNKLFDKKLPQADTEHKFYIPNQYENIFFSPDFGFSPINSDQGTKIAVTFYDTAERKPWEVVFYRSAGADHRSHLTHNWSGFAREKNLKKDDVISFYKLKTKKGTFLMIGVEKGGFIFGKDFNNVEE